MIKIGQIYGSTEGGLLFPPGSGGGGGFDFSILDTYTNADVAYDLILLRTAYSGSSIRVRRDSDNAEQDIGFDEFGLLDTAAMLTFTGAGSGFVTTYYDQSGNGNDLTQSTSALQFRIVLSGVVEVSSNGLPCFQRTALSNIMFLDSTFAFPSVYTHLIVTRSGSGHGQGLTTEGEKYPLLHGGGNGMYVNNGSFANFGTITKANLQMFAACRRSNGFGKIFFDGAQFGSDLDLGTVTADNLSRAFNFFANANDEVSTCIFWSIDFTDDIIAIEDDLNGYYNIY